MTTEVKQSWPVVNMNGDSVNTLLDNHRAASDALRVAAEAMAKNAPHGRNYQTGGDYPIARGEFMDRLEALNDMADEMQNIAMYLYDIKLESGK